MQEKLVITIVHQLPGRLRMILSHAPTDPDATIEHVREHKGIDSIEYTSISGSMVVRFNPLEVSREEIVIRVACSLSLDYHEAPVRILVQAETKELDSLSFYSGLAIAVALATRPVLQQEQMKRRLDWATGIGTAGAVLSHGWQEVRHRGYFDPEVLSVVYLGAAMLRGQFLSAALVTWFTTFGRHLFRPAPQGVELRITRNPDSSNGNERFGVRVGPDPADKTVTRYLRFIPAVIQYAVIGGAVPGGSSLLGAIRDVAGVHDEVLDGLGNMKYGIPIRVSSL